jgi:hypothetical protein
MSDSYIESRGYAFVACMRTTSADVVVVTEVSCALGKKALGILTRNHKAFFCKRSFCLDIKHWQPEALHGVCFFGTCLN